MRRTCIILLLILCVLFLSACGKTANEDPVLNEASVPLNSEDSHHQIEEGESQIAPADGYDLLGGVWEVSGIYYNNKVISIHDSSGLESLYSGTFLSFDEDGTFIYYNYYLTEGTYSRINGGNSFLLRANRCYRLEYQNGEMVEIDSTDPSLTSYIVEPSSGSGNGPTLRFSELDSITGKAKVNGDPLVFVKS